jgi:hypothetical protein
MIYVDELRDWHGKLRYRTCHLFADTIEELEAFVDLMGLDHRWRHNEHYDISAKWRELAVGSGAIEVSVREAARIVKKKYNRVTKMKFILDVTVAHAETNGAVDLDADSIAELIDFF